MTAKTAATTLDLPGVTMTTVTRNVLTLAASAGLRPHRGTSTGNGRVSVNLNGPHPESMFGVVYISVQSGAILASYLVPGNGNAETRYDGAARTRTAIRVWADQNGIL